MRSLCAWDAVIPSGETGSLPTIYVPVFAVAPVSAFTHSGRVHLLFPSEMITLHASNELAKRLEPGMAIIIAEADEGLSRTTTLLHTDASD